MTRATLAVFVASTFLSGACAIGQHGSDVYDGFEGSTLSRIWNTRKLPPSALVMQPDVVREGRRAARITLRAGDQIADEAGSELERAELEEARAQESVADRTYRYSFSLFLPRDFPVVPTRLVLAQWKQRCRLESCTPDNPTLAIRYENGELFITHQTTRERRELYRTTRDIRNHWLDVRFELRFTRASTGLIKAWLDDAPVVDYAGVNAYPADAGYDDRFYFKVGLYRDRMTQPMTIFVDEYRKTQF
jgi:hypothetical protein